DHVTLYHGDCLQLTAWLEADVLVTDPPYGIAWKRHRISRVSAADRARGDYRTHVRHSFNDIGIQNDETTEARDAALAMWGTKKASVVFGSLLLPPPRGTKQTAVYVKPEDSGNLTSVSGIRRNVEAIYLIGSAHVTGGGGRSAVFGTGARTAGNPNGLAARYGGHPHAKPVDVLEQLILTCPPGVIADPFAGSGSTLVAARNLGRRAIGVEVEERYCEVIARRLAQSVLDFGDAS
ncbi:site-specific DNA-methyltransferase, partial [Sporichthya brevicatena]|uniref:site-specific DNA-methyltransferase n=1 Tax=Sporichthya brevicatena TaxID=171442 RepID=UPI0031DECD9F